ncbi:MAG: tRNA dihydrouridine synthase DusB [Vicinamibacterales bacterium]|nr:tRNA dihydrouridine synthase DusB [Vicinamibacterales bacterium]
MKIANIPLASPFVVSPMAGMTDTGFRRLVKRQGGCGLVVTEMVSSEGIVRGIDRTLEYAEYTEEERPVSVQIFGGDPATMAEAARVVEGMGADIVDVNMGCPVPKISKHNAGCSLMRDPAHAERIIREMVQAVKIPVTVKMRKGWDEGDLSAPEVAARVENAGASAVTIHGRTAKQSYGGHADWDFVADVASRLSIPVFGSGDCVEPEQIVERMRAGVSGVFVGRGVLRNPWILAQAQDLLEGRAPRSVSLEERGRFLLAYIDLLLGEAEGEADGFRHSLERKDAQSRPLGADSREPAVGRQKWVINKLRALCGWYSKGLEGGAQLRVSINSAQSIPHLRELVEAFFLRY